MLTEEQARKIAYEELKKRGFVNIQQWEVKECRPLNSGWAVELSYLFYGTVVVEMDCKGNVTRFDKVQ